MNSEKKSIFCATNALLVLADGTVFEGYGIGTEGEAIGELCFNTSITGYQEILTDPSYAGQIITFTFPHIGNVGTNDEDIESDKIAASGLIIREAITNPSNYRSQKHLNSYLADNKITGISGVDTRALTSHIRTKGAQNAIISFNTNTDIDALKAKASALPSLKGMELAEENSCDKNHEFSQKLWQWDEGYKNQNESSHHIVAVDFGVKKNILRNLAELGCKITVVPAKISADEILGLNPDGVFLSNGPGDPAATGEYAIPMIKELIETKIPIFGICLGHQMLGLAAGCNTEKMHQGHRGANHPVQDLRNGKVEITSQNHGFVISDNNLPDMIEVTHRSLFDQTIQGIALKNTHVFSVQGHPEASPGPHDSAYLFKQFIASIIEHKNKNKAAA